MSSKKEVEYAAKLVHAIQQVFNTENEKHIDTAELNEGDNSTHFIHALANLAPALIYDNMTGGKSTLLEFNHVANQLCFQYANKK